MKKLVAPIMAAVLAASMAVPAMADYKVSYNPSGVVVSQVESKTKLTFRDVDPSNWAYKPIMNMVSKGLIAGTKEADANGVGEFSPNSPMTRAQFITIVTRYLYPDDIKAQKSRQGDQWYTVNYNVAIENGLIKKSEFNGTKAVMDVAMSRQEMAMVLVRAMDALGENTSAKASTSSIPDYNKVGTAYKDYVRIAYQAGMIAGMDNTGRFAPMDTMTRAQAATVLYRLIEPSARVTPKDNSDNGSVHYDPTGGATTQTGSQTIYEGRPTTLTPKAGDVFVKADGTKVVLKETVLPNGTKIVGLGQGCNLYCGYKYATGVVVKDGIAAPDGTSYEVSELTNECYSSKDWSAIQQYTEPTEAKGAYDGEVKNTYWRWDANAWHPENGTGRWTWTGPHFMY